MVFRAILLRENRLALDTNKQLIGNVNVNVC